MDPADGPTTASSENHQNENTGDAKSSSSIPEQEHTPQRDSTGENDGNQSPLNQLFETLRKNTTSNEEENSSNETSRNSPEKLRRRGSLTTEGKR